MVAALVAMGTQGHHVAVAKPSWSAPRQTGLPSPLCHSTVTVKHKKPTNSAKFHEIWTLAPASSSLFPSIGINSGLDIVHIDLYLSYLKISGVLGLGGGSAAYETFKRNEGGQDNKERRGREKRLLVVM